tara:strand:+ start:1291 stop:1419 length:129 start_codon:yes stop_codon:yes gene_type:complete
MVVSERSRNSSDELEYHCDDSKREEFIREDWKSIALQRRENN